MLKDERPAGYGFVMFATPGEAVKAIIGMDGKQTGNRKLKVRYRQTRDEVQAQEKFENDKFNKIKKSKYSNLYVGNLDKQIFHCDQKLYEEFQCFGTIISAKV